MTDFIYAGHTYTLELFDEIWSFGQRTNTPWDFWSLIGFGESHLNENEVTGDQGESVGTFQVNKIHWSQQGAQEWLGVLGTRHSMDYLWGNRWEANLGLLGGIQGAWQTWIGRKSVPPEHFLPLVVYQGEIIPPDPRVGRLGRAETLYHMWPRIQGSTRPRWETCLQVVAEATLLCLAYAETRSPVPVPQPVPDLTLARQVVDDFTKVVEAVNDSSARAMDLAARLAVHRQSAQSALDVHVRTLGGELPVEFGNGNTQD